MKKIYVSGLAALVLSVCGVQMASAKMLPQKDAGCPYLQGGICYSLPGEKTGCGDLDTVSQGGVNYCKLGPKNNPKPLPSLRTPAQTQGING